MSEVKSNPEPLLNGTNEERAEMMHQIAKAVLDADTMIFMATSKESEGMTLVVQGKSMDLINMLATAMVNDKDGDGTHFHELIGASLEACLAHKIKSLAEKIGGDSDGQEG